MGYVSCITADTTVSIFCKDGLTEETVWTDGHVLECPEIVCDAVNAQCVTASGIQDDDPTSESKCKYLECVDTAVFATRSAECKADLKSADTVKDLECKSDGSALVTSVVASTIVVVVGLFF